MLLCAYGSYYALLVVCYPFQSHSLADWQQLWALLLHLLYQLLWSESIGKLEGESTKKWLAVICLSQARSWRIRWWQRRDGIHIQLQVCIFKSIRYFYFIYLFFRLQLCKQEPRSSWRGLTTTKRGLRMSDNLNLNRVSGLQVRKWLQVFFRCFLFTLLMSISRIGYVATEREMMASWYVFFLPF